MHPRAALSLLLAIPIALAGCIGTSDDAAPASIDGLPTDLDELSEALYDTIVRTEAAVAGEGDTRLWLDVYKPEVPADVKLPTILLMTPYQSLGDGLAPLGADSEQCKGPKPQDCPYSPWLVEFFAPRGYAVAFADVRGNHNAGGCIDQTGPKQWEDGVRVIEWLASQEWSNGNVGMIGVSYDGETQQSTALLAPPALKTIVPVASVAGQYDYIFYNGVPYELQGLGTMGGYLAFSLLPGQDPEALPYYHERVACQPENFQAAADLSGDMTPYWTDREYRLHADQVTTSVLHIHGLADWNVKPIHIAGWYNELVNAENRRAIYGQWGHQYPDRGDWFGEGGIVHRWFDQFLLEKETGILAELPPVLIEDTDGEWRGIDSFPPLEQPVRTLQLNADLTITDEPTGAGEVVIHDYPRDEMGVGFGPVSPGSAAATVGEAVVGHPVAVEFTGEPLEEPLRLTGRPSVTFTATTSEVSTHWVAHLYALDGDEWTELNRGYQDTRHLAGLDAPSDLTPGEAYEVTIEMFPQDDVVPAGATLVLWISNEDGWVHQDTTFAMSTIALGDGSAVLRLPLDPGGQSYPEDSLVPYAPRPPANDE